MPDHGPLQPECEEDFSANCWVSDDDIHCQWCDRAATCFSPVLKELFPACENHRGDNRLSRTADLDRQHKVREVLLR